MRTPRPLHDRIIVRRIDEAETVRGGIIIPDASKEKPSEGIVTAVGPGRMSEYMHSPIMLNTCVGDRILFGKYSGVEIKIDGEDMLIMREEEVLCILVETPTDFALPVEIDDMPF